MAPCLPFDDTGAQTTKCQKRDNIFTCSIDKTLVLISRAEIYDDFYESATKIFPLEFPLIDTMPRRHNFTMIDIEMHESFLSFMTLYIK